MACQSADPWHGHKAVSAALLSAFDLDDVRRGLKLGL